LEEKYAMLGESLLLSVVVKKGGEKQSQKQRDKQLQALRKDILPLWEKGAEFCEKKRKNEINQFNALIERNRSGKNNPLV
jgi:hypothetical protein